MKAAHLDADESAIIAVIAAREAAWNAGDIEGYASLLTEDADVVSATGKPAYGRGALLNLYAEQRADVYAGVRTHTRVTRVRMVGPGVALADAEYRLEGGKADTLRQGLIAFILRWDAQCWKISAIRGMPAR